jgi:hypothetical protein
VLALQTLCKSVELSLAYRVAVSEIVGTHFRDSLTEVDYSFQVHFHFPNLSIVILTFIYLDKKASLLLDFSVAVRDCNPLQLQCALSIFSSISFSVLAMQLN